MRTRLTRTPCPSRLCAKLTRPSPAPTSPHPNTRNRPFYPTTRRRRLLLGQLGTTTSKKHRDKKRLPIGRHCDDSRAPVRPESAISACPETTFLKMCRSQPAPSWHPVAKGALLILDHISHVSRGISSPLPSLTTRRPAGGPRACADVSGEGQGASVVSLPWKPVAAAHFGVRPPGLSSAGRGGRGGQARVLPQSSAGDPSPGRRWPSRPPSPVLD